MNHSKLMTDVITTKQFHDIPDWLIDKVDNDTFFGIVDAIYYILQEDERRSFIAHNENFCDVVNILRKIRSCGNIDLKTIIRHFTTPNNIQKGLKIFQYFFNSDADWKTFLIMAEKTNSFPIYLYQKYQLRHNVSDLLDGAKIYYRQFGHIPTAIVKYILGCVDYYSIHNDVFDAKSILNLLFKEFENIPKRTSNDYGLYEGNLHFTNDLFDAILSFSSTYYWINTVFSVENLWNRHISYYPVGLNPSYIYNYLYCMTTLDENKWIELSDNILPGLKSIVQSSEYDIYFKEELCDMIGFIISNSLNLNNVRFLQPFRDDLVLSWKAIHYAKDVSSMMVDEKLGKCGMVRGVAHFLRDYRYIGCLFTDGFNNDVLQRKFLEQFGNPDSLIPEDGNPSTFLFTREGVLCMLENSTFEQIERVFLNEDILNIIQNDIVGKEHFSPLVSKLVPHLEIHRWNPIVLRIISHVYTSYSVIDIYKGNRDVLKILPLSRFEIDSIIKTSPWTMSEIPFCKQNYDDFISRVNSKKSYVPVYFDSENAGLECYLNIDQLMFLVKTNSGYVGDIKSASVARRLTENYFIWGNHDYDE